MLASSFGTLVGLLLAIGLAGLIAWGIMRALLAATAPAGIRWFVGLGLGLAAFLLLAAWLLPVMSALRGPDIAGLFSNQPSTPYYTNGVIVAGQSSDNNGQQLYVLQNGQLIPVTTNGQQFTTQDFRSGGMGGENLQANVCPAQPKDLGPWAPSQSGEGENFEVTANETVSSGVHVQLWWPGGSGQAWEKKEISVFVPAGLSIEVQKGAGKGWEYALGCNNIQAEISADNQRRTTDTSFYGQVDVDTLIQTGLVKVRFDRR